MKIIKKDGQFVDYDSDKIYRAVYQASKKINDENESNKLAKNIESLITNEINEIETDEITTEIIQALIENFLMSFDKEVAVRFIEYRNNQDIQRKGVTNITKSVQRVIMGDKNIINENANKDGNKFPVIRDLTAGSVAKSIGLKQMLPKKVANAHLKGDIHYHDLDYQPYSPMTNCCLINFEDMLKNGTRIGNAIISTPKSINTAVALTAQIVANVSSNQYGGCSFNRMDEVLAPYAKLNYNKHLKENILFAAEMKDIVLDENITGIPKHLFSEKEVQLIIKRTEEKTKKDIFDSIQGLEFEIQTIYNANGQTPFFTVGFGLGTNWFEREIQKAIFQNRLRGIGEGRIAIFPKLVFTLKDGLNLRKTDPNYDIKQLALECTSKCMYPDILNYDKIVEITGDFKAPMGCRSFLNSWVNEQGENEVDGRYNIGVTTLNLPRIAIQANHNLKKFWKIFHERMLIIKEATEFRLKRTLEASPINAPILYSDGAFGRLTKDGDVWNLMKNKRATVSLGYIGLYEVATLLFGENWQENLEAKEFTIEILKEMTKYANKWSDELNIKASVYGTPSESLTDRFCKLDREKFGIIENITDKEYYTNSFHYDTREKITPFDKINFEKDYLPYTSGGFICYVELTNAQQNLKALEDVWDYAYDKVGYFAVNTPIDKCFECNFHGEFLATDEGYVCPQCGNSDPEKSDVIKRMCGYLGQPLSRPEAHGRHKEIKSRVKHDS